MSQPTTDVLLEIGTEEIPDRFLPGALTELAARFTKLFEDEALGPARVRVLGTPRRLAVLAEGVKQRQADRTEELVGPPVSAAFDASGKPTPAAIGFAKKVGIPVESLRRVQSDKGERVAGERAVPGLAVAEILARDAPRLVETLPWPKNMRWGDGRYTWVRPVQWVVALAGTDLVDLEVFGIRSGRDSQGHRRRHPAPVRIESPSRYVEALRAASVVVDRDERRAAIAAGLTERAREMGFEVVADAGLLDATCDLVEWPVVIAATFDHAYLDLPDVVLSTVMRVHQRYFALQDGSGRLVPAFLAVANQPDPDGTIARNNASVLVARLDDARFFFAKDRQAAMESRIALLADVMFHEKLGTYLDKVRRMERLAVHVIPEAGLAQLHDVEDMAALVKAVELSKADQTTEMVKELPELQGIMGGIYMRLEGYGEDASRAVEEHYLPGSVTDPVPASPLGAVLSAVDKTDTLVGCFGVGLLPTGSKDPFGLRRAAQGLVRTLLESGLSLSLGKLVAAASEGCEELPGYDPARIEGELMPFLEGRLRFLLSEGVSLAGDGGSFAPDEVSAVVAAGWDDLPGVLARVRALHDVRKTRQDDFEALSVAFKRVRNIVRGQARGRVDRSLLAEPAEKALAEKLADVREKALPLMGAGEHAKALEAMASLRPEVDAFFDHVMVMVEDEPTRKNRVALLQEVEDLFLREADVSEIQVAAAT